MKGENVVVYKLHSGRGRPGRGIYRAEAIIILLYISCMKDHRARMDIAKYGHRIGEFNLDDRPADAGHVHAKCTSTYIRIVGVFYAVTNQISPAVSRITCSQ